MEPAAHLFSFQWKSLEMNATCTRDLQTWCCSQDGAVPVFLPFLLAHVQRVAPGLHLAREQTIWAAKQQHSEVLRS